MTSPTQRPAGQTPITDNAMQQIACFASHPAVECLSDLARRMESDRAVLLELLRQIEITECVDCGGTGKAPRTKDDACRFCGGSGEISSRLFSGDVRAAIKRAKEEA